MQALHRHVLGMLNKTASRVRRNLNMYVFMYVCMYVCMYLNKVLVCAAISIKSVLVCVAISIIKYSCASQSQ